MAELLVRFLPVTLYLAIEHEALIETMNASRHTGDDRIRARLPAATTVADKTGIFWQAPVNDVGAITLPNRKGQRQLAYSLRK